MPVPFFVARYAMGLAGDKIGGPIGGALGVLGATSAAVTEAYGTLAQRLNDGTARASDVVYANFRSIAA
jgi:hypothetical protein